MEYECIRLGVRLRWLGTDRLTWRDLALIINFAPRESPLAREVEPEKALWGLTDQLMAATVDQLRVANWQRGGAKGERPKPLRRPGIGDDKPDQKQRRFGGGMNVMTLEQAKVWREKRRGR